MVKNRSIFDCQILFFILFLDHFHTFPGEKLGLTLFSDSPLHFLYPATPVQGPIHSCFQLEFDMVFKFDLGKAENKEGNVPMHDRSNPVLYSWRGIFLILLKMLQFNLLMMGPFMWRFTASQTFTHTCQFLIRHGHIFATFHHGNIYFYITFINNALEEFLMAQSLW